MLKHAGFKRNKDVTEYDNDSAKAPCLENRRRMIKVSLSEAPSLFEGPYYEKATLSLSGGNKSRAILGPNALIAMGSDSNAQMPGGISAARSGLWLHGRSRHE